MKKVSNTKFGTILVPFGTTSPITTKIGSYKLFKQFWTTFSKGIFWLDEHRKTLGSKSAKNFGCKMPDTSDILYISTALKSVLKYLIDSR